jgi:hypothetical protein
MSDGNKMLNFEEREVDVGGHARQVLIARPAVEVRLDAERLERMRKGDFASLVDLEILQAVAGRDSKVSIVVFDARDAESKPSWRFDVELDDAQRMEFGLHLLKSQISLYRELVRLGVSGLVGVGFGSFELAAFQRGTVRVVTELSEELESADPPRAAQIDIDLWLIEHAATWTGLPLAEYMKGKLAEEIAERDRKRPEIDRLLEAAAKSEA